MQSHPPTDVFAAVASPTRRALLGLLRQGEVPATVLAEQFDLTQPAISQQLRTLREAGLVDERREGRLRLYRLRAERLREIAAWVEQYEDFWQTRFARLDKYLSTNRHPRTSKASHQPTRRKSR